MHRPMTPTALRGCAALLGVAALCATIAPAPARADTVTDWNDYASTAIVVIAGQPPPVAVLSFAMVQGAVYDAVERDRSRPPPVSRRAAGPAARTPRTRRPRPRRSASCVGLFPAQQRRCSRSTTRRSPRSPDTPPGAKAARRSPTARRPRRRCSPRGTNDGRFGPFTPVIGTTPGVWRPTPPLFATDPAPWVGNVRPFLVPSVEMLRTDGPNAADQPRLRPRLQRDQVRSARCTARPARRTRPTRRSSGRTTPSRCATACSAPSPPTSTCRHRRQRAAVRDDQPGRRRRGDRLLERQVPLELLAPDHRHPRGRHRRQPGHHGRPDLDCRCSTRPRPSPRRAAARHPAVPRQPVRPHLRHRRDRRHAAALLRHRPRRRSARPATSPAPPGTSPGSPTRCARSSTPASGPASTSAPPTSRAPSSARRSPATCTGTTSSPPTEPVLHPDPGCDLQRQTRSVISRMRPRARAPPSSGRGSR